MLNYLNNNLIPYINNLQNNISIKDFVAYLINDKNDTDTSCLLLQYIIIPLFFSCRYKTYKYKYFEQKFNKKQIDAIKTHIKIKNLIKK